MEEKYTILGPSLVCQWTGDCNVGTGTSRDPPKKIVVMCKGRSKKEPLASPSTWTGRFTTTSSDCIDIADSLEYIKWLMLKQCDRQSPVVGQYTCLLQPQPRGTKFLVNPRQPWWLPDPYTYHTGIWKSTVWKALLEDGKPSTPLHHYVTICTTAQDSGATVSKAVPMSLQLLLGCDGQPSQQVAWTTAEIEMTRPRLAKSTWFLGSECVCVYKH